MLVGSRLLHSDGHFGRSLLMVEQAKHELILAVVLYVTHTVHNASLVSTSCYLTSFMTVITSFDAYSSDGLLLVCE